jgi:hypothetical protein
MSQPHTGSGLTFTRHPKKPHTFVPGRHTSNRVLGLLAVFIAAFLIGLALSTLFAQ